MIARHDMSSDHGDEMNSSELNSSFETNPFSCRTIDEFNNELNSSELKSTYETGLIHRIAFYPPFVQPAPEIYSPLHYMFSYPKSKLQRLVVSSYSVEVHKISRCIKAK
jgi:hypothetical protein